jgi:hypothetical protein
MRGDRRGIILPTVLAVLVTTAMLSALVLFSAAQEQRVAGLAMDRLRARAAAMEGLAQASAPPDPEELCLRPPLAPMEVLRTTVSGGTVRLRWRHLGAGLVRFEVEGRGGQGSRWRFLGYLRPDPPPTSLPFGCPGATRLVPVGPRWLDGHPEG